MTEIQPLVVTPKPMPNESYKGYILRVSESNGYISINSMLRYAGMEYSEIRSSIPNLGKLKLLVGNDLKEFAFLAVKIHPTHYPLSPSYNIPKFYLHSQKPHLCPICIIEQGYISAFSEIKYALVCPLHAVLTINKCPSCFRTLDIFRVGLTICKCRYDFRHDKPMEANNPSLLALMHIIKSKLENADLDELMLKSVGFPIEYFLELPLNTLLSFISRIEGRYKKSVEGDLLGAVSQVALIFKNWPQGFYQYLEQEHAPEANLDSFGLRQQFLPIYESLFKNGLPPDEMIIFRQAFVEYGRVKWCKALIDRKLGTNVRTIVGIYGIAEALNKQPSTIRHMVQRGQIPIHRQNSQGRMLFKITRKLLLEFNLNQYLTEYDAAKFLGVSTQALVTYKRLGFYQTNFISYFSDLYRTEDLGRLVQELTSDVKITQRPFSRYEIGFGNIMSKGIGSKIKAMLIEAVRVKYIVPIGRVSDSPSSIFFWLDEVNKVMTNMATPGFKFTNNDRL